MSPDTSDHFADLLRLLIQKQNKTFRQTISVKERLHIIICRQVIFSNHSFSRIVLEKLQFLK